MDLRLPCSLVIGVAAVACARGPVELGFWLEPVSYASPRLDAPISSAELATIETIARDEIVSAFDHFSVVVTASRRARYHVRVVQELRDRRFRRDVRVAGESRGAAGFGGSGAVSFEFIASGAMVYAPHDAGREELLAAIGRGIGRSAVHEFAHQLLPRTPIHDTVDRRSYEFYSAARPEQYFGDVHWDLAGPLLHARFGTR
jgi:hypothetical protein